MKDEIKEILDKLKIKSVRYNHHLKYNMSYENKDEDYEAHLLLDYITNLQEEIKSLKGSCKALGKKCENQRKELIVLSHNLSKKNVKVQTLKTNMKELQQENERLRVKKWQIKELKKEWSDINENSTLVFENNNLIEFMNKLENILKGDNMTEEQMKHVANLISQNLEKDKEIERLNNIIKNLDKMFEYYFLDNLKYDQDTVNTIYIKYVKLKE